MLANSEIRKGSRPATVQRRRLIDAQHRRGHAKAAIWYGYSPKLRSDLIISSTLAWWHFLTLEADSALLSYRLDTTQQILCEHCNKAAHAELIYLNHRVQCHTILRAGEEKPDLVCCESRGPSHVENRPEHKFVQEEELAKRYVELTNWSRIISWLASFRYHSLAQYREDIRHLVHGATAFRLGQLEDHYEEGNVAIARAAAFDLIRTGHIRADLTKRPITRGLVLSVRDSK